MEINVKLGLWKFLLVIVNKNILRVEFFGNIYMLVFFYSFIFSY